MLSTHLCQLHCRLTVFWIRFVSVFMMQWDLALGQRWCSMSQLDLLGGATLCADWQPLYRITEVAECPVALLCRAGVAHHVVIACLLCQIYLLHSVSQCLRAGRQHLFQFGLCHMLLNVGSPTVESTYMEQSVLPLDEPSVSPSSSPALSSVSASR